MESSAPFFATDGTCTTVDWNEYSLTLDQAVEELHNGNNILALPFPDYSADEVYDIYPYPDTLYAEDFKNSNKEATKEYLCQWDKYSKA